MKRRRRNQQLVAGAGPSQEEGSDARRLPTEGGEFLDGAMNLFAILSCE